MEYEMYLRFGLALVVVLGMILAAAWVARRLGLGTPMPGGKRKRRLTLVEVMVLDNKRRLVLVRRDEREHLLLLGGVTDVVVEAGITSFRDALASPAPEDPSS